MVEIELGKLKPGEVYGNGKYRVISNDGEVIKILRLSDNNYISFHDKHINWKHKVKKDD